MNHYGTHLRIERDWEGVAWLVLDRAGAQANWLSAAMLDELGEVVGMLEADPPSGLIIASAQAAGFSPGADPDEIDAAVTPQAARALVARGWAVFGRIARLPLPTLALIRGHCLGGGLELALACDYRVVVEGPATRLGLPQVRVGLVPAWGGMRRLPALVGPSLALELMLSGRELTARGAWKAGLADVCVPPRVMEAAARAVVMSGRHSRHLPWREVLKATLLRRFVAARARRALAPQLRADRYPAPFALLELWVRHGGDTLAEADESPASMAALLRSDATRELRRVSALHERLRRGGRVAHGVAHVHVVGAGAVGGELAILCAANGFRVTLQDLRQEAIAAVIGHAAQRASELHPDDVPARRELLDRLVPDGAGHGVRRADLIIEAAVTVDVAAKRALLAGLESRARPDALLASHTACLALADVAAGMHAPARLVGLHLPVVQTATPLVEVAAEGPDAADAIARASGFVAALGKLPLAVAGTPGFLINAVLAPYLLEALRCIDEGVPAAAVDHAMREAGMAVGPIETVDRLGLDVLQSLACGLGLDSLPTALSEAVAAGRLGLRSGRGLYEWRDGVPLRDAGAAPDGVAERLFARLDAAARDALSRGIVRDADLVDAGLIAGAGYPPYTGGPMRHAARHEDRT